MLLKVEVPGLSRFREFFLEAGALGEDCNPIRLKMGVRIAKQIGKGRQSARRQNVGFESGQRLDSMSDDLCREAKVLHGLSQEGRLSKIRFHKSDAKLRALLFGENCNDEPRKPPSRAQIDPFLCILRAKREDLGRVGNMSDPKVRQGRLAYEIDGGVPATH